MRPKRRYSALDPVPAVNVGLGRATTGYARQLPLKSKNKIAHLVIVVPHSTNFAAISNARLTARRVGRFAAFACASSSARGQSLPLPT